MPLSDEGRAQAAELADVFAGETFARIVTSDLSRARETAATIAGSRPFLTDARWREFAFGDWEGLRVGDVDPGTNARLYAPPGGETFEHVCARVRDALNDLQRDVTGRALVVTHAGTLHAMLAVLFEEPVHVRFVPASITCVRLGARSHLLCLGKSVRQYADARQNGTLRQG